MRDNSTNMIELVDAITVNDLYFSIIKRHLNGADYTLKFGVTKDDYNKLKYILTYRPFENTGVGVYKYFYAGSYQKNGHSEGVSIIYVRVEQLKQHKQFQFPIGNLYLSNLIWFSEIKDKAIFEPFALADTAGKTTETAHPNGNARPWWKFW